jgi:glycosyltransferase involved in cell wall biosynthesis
MKLAVLFDNFGPYHIARLNASSAEADVLGVEFAAESGDYSWLRTSAAVRFRRCTLFADGPSHECSTQVLRARLHQSLRDFRPDVVAIPGWSGRLAFEALAWCRRNSVPAIAMSESTAADQARWWWREAVKRRCLTLFDAGLAGGPPQRDYLVQLGMRPGQVFLGYDAVDNEYFSCGAAAARSSAAAVRAKLNLPSRYFLASARFIAKKNLHNLLHAHAQYRERVASASSARSGGSSVPWSLVILGDGPLRHGLQATRDLLGLNSYVHFPGFLQYEELPNYFGLAGAFIHPSLVEQWGLVVNEAMASGLPVLASQRCGCVPTLLREGVNGFTFDPSSIDEMADAMLRISTMPEPERLQFGRASESIVSDVGPEQFAHGLMSAAKAALTRHATRRRLGDSFLLRALLASAR